MREDCVKRFLSHIFGSASSSCITSFVVRYLANMLKDEFPPNVIEAIERHFYVDDGHGGDDNLEEAVRLKANLKLAMAKGGLPLGKWKANHPALLEREPGQPEPQLEDKFTKVLGVHWNPLKDEFRFMLDISTLKLPAKTPRQLVAIQSSLFDPNGFISLFI